MRLAEPARRRGGPVAPRLTPFAVVPLVVILAGLAAACSGGPGRTGVDDPLPSILEVTSAPSSDASPSPPAHLATEAPPASAGEVGQRDTAWGRIWDELPAGFPVVPDAAATDEAGAGEQVSAAFTVQGVDPAEIAQWLQTELEVATYSTEALSGPLEDGSFVIDSVGDRDCRIESVVTPTGDTTLLTVRFGAACPFE
jgi:hypothetical protein